MTKSSYLDECLQDAFQKAFEQLNGLAGKRTKHCEDKIRHVNEAVFRYWFINHLYSNESFTESYVIEDEWHRIDLLIRSTKPGGQHAAIEFKFYDARPLYTLDGELERYKGGAGNRNLREFLVSTIRLDEKRKVGGPLPEDSLAYIVMVYVDEDSRAHCFADHYEIGKTAPHLLDEIFGEKIPELKNLSLTLVDRKHESVFESKKNATHKSYKLRVIGMPISTSPEKTPTANPPIASGWIARLD